jgi:hypothetical protein
MMRSVFEVYQDLWPEPKRRHLQQYLSRVKILHHPEDSEKYAAGAPGSVVLAVKDIKLRDILTLTDLGFEHIVQIPREDLAIELLASSLMVLRPEAFLKNPIPFFLSGFDSESIVSDPDRNLVMRFTKSSEKTTLLEWLGVFLDRNPSTMAIRDLCLQTADEMISNALFNAPVRPSGKRAFKDLPRDTEMELPGSQAGSLFACFADDRVVVGCQDPFGSLEQGTLMGNLHDVLREGPTSISYSPGGAGLGFKFLLENCANFYVLVNKGKSTLVACTFLLKGLKANMTVNKHFHVSFR